MILTVQQAMLDRLSAVLGPGLAYEALPASIDLGTQLSLRHTRLPAVFVAFLGGDNDGGNQVHLESEFGVFVVTAGASEKGRREGGPGRSSGALAILQRLLPALHAHVVPEVGSLTLRSVVNLYSEALDKAGLTVYSASFHIMLGLEMEGDPAWDLAPLDSLTGTLVAAGTDAPLLPANAAMLTDLSGGP
jgi:phage gp37-like protein